jgi:hypothetical protein
MFAQIASVVAQILGKAHDLSDPREPRTWVLGAVFFSIVLVGLWVANRRER